MKRLLKNGVYLAAIVAIIVLASRMYDTGRSDGQCQENIKNASFPGTNPDEKIAYLADCINIVYGENISVSGRYDLQGNFVEYGIHLDFTRAIEPGEFIILTEIEKRGIGELAMTTAKLLVPVDMEGTVYEGVGISGMAIIVSTINVARRDEGREGQLYYEPAPYLQDGTIKELHVFGREDLEKLAKETNSLNWEIYQSPSNWTPYFQNIGTIKK